MEDVPQRAKDRARGKARTLPIWLAALLSQLLGVFAGFAAYVASIQQNAPLLDTFEASLIAGVIAAFCGHKFFRLPIWWLVINSVFLPGAWLAHNGDWPTWLFGGLFIVTLLVFWNVIRDRVPLYLSNESTSIAIATLMENLRPEALTPTANVLGGSGEPVGRFCDLGSGTGGFASRLATACPRWQVVGYESAPVLWLISIFRASFAPRQLLTFQRRNFWTQNLGTFDVVYAFLSPQPMEKLFAKVKSEMKPGSIFISNSFDVPGETPDEIQTLDDRRKTQLLIWRL